MHRYLTILAAVLAVALPSLPASADRATPPPCGYGSCYSPSPTLAPSPAPTGTLPTRLSPGRAPELPATDGSLALTYAAVGFGVVLLGVVFLVALGPVRRRHRGPRESRHVR